MAEQNIVKLKVWGPWACFTRPEMKVERVSYPVMTPSAARGILEAILWKPEFRWVIHRILVLKDIRFQSVRRNEVQKAVSTTEVRKWMQDPGLYEPFYADIAGRIKGGKGENRTPRNTLALKDVAYMIEAEIRLTEWAGRSRNKPLDEDEQPGDNTITKYVCMFNRRVEKGQCFHRPCLGIREFAADFGPPDGSERPIQDSRGLGRMLYDVVYADNSKPVFFDPDADGLFRNGVLTVSPEIVLKDEVVREEVLACSYKG